MLLDDSIEFDHSECLSNAEPLPVNWDIDLPKIWIPSSLLPNRMKQINSNENKPLVLGTLEKPDYSNTFSVYADECLQYHESPTLSPALSKISLKLMNNSIDKLHLPQALPSSQNATEWDGRLGIENKKDISGRHQVNNKLDYSLTDSQHLYASVNKNAAQYAKEASNTCSVQEAKCKASLEDLTHKMAEILFDDQSFKQNWHHEDTIDSTLDSIPPSAKDSLEEIYFSDEYENQFDIEEYELGNLEMESPKKKRSCNTYLNNSYVQELPSESFVNSLEGLELDKSSSDKTAHQPFEETEEMSSEGQKISVDNAIYQTEECELNKVESIVHMKDFEQELPNSEEKSEDISTGIVEFFPVAYKRPPVQEHINKIKPQKEKKKTKKAKKYIHLEDLFQSEEVDRFKIPEVDEFYENLVRQGKCEPRDQKTNMDRFSFENLTEKLQTKSLEFPSETLPDKSQNLFWDSAQKLIESMSSEPQSNFPDKIIRGEEKVEPRHESAFSLDTLIIDNIPLNVSKENIEIFILEYGELKNLIIERRGKFQRAKLLMDFIYDIDWIIDCLNDSQPFGSSEAELIKCYRQK